MKKLLIFLLLTVTMFAQYEGGYGRGSASASDVLNNSVVMWGDSFTAQGDSNYQSFISNRTVYNRGVPGDLSHQVNARFQADASTKNMVHIFWVGYNNITQGLGYKVKQSLDSMIALLGHSNYAVVSVLNCYQRGYLPIANRPLYDSTIALNNQLIASYPGHYVYLRTHLMTKTLNARDISDVTDSLMIPFSLRQTDGVHLTSRINPPNGVAVTNAQYGYRIVAEYFKAYLDTHYVANFKDVSASSLSRLFLYSPVLGNVTLSSGSKILSNGINLIGLSQTTSLNNYFMFGGGYNALGANIGNYDNINIGIGEKTLASASLAGAGHIAMGSQALQSVTSGTSDIGIGYQALNANNGAENTGVGYKVAAQSLGNYETYVGSRAGYNKSLGGLSVGVGYSALYSASGARVDSTIAVGSFAGYSASNNSKNNVFIGHRAGSHSTTSNRLFIDNQDRLTLAQDSTRALIYGNFDADSSKQLLTINGDLKYLFRHAIGNVESATYTPTVAQNAYTKISTGAVVWSEADGITAVADSMTIVRAGDYFINYSVTLSGSNAGDFWQIKIFKNNIAVDNVGRFRFKTVTNSTTDTRAFFWYLSNLTVGDRLSFYITNETGTRNPTITDMKIYIEKKPE